MCSHTKFWAESTTLILYHKRIKTKREFIEEGWNKFILFFLKGVGGCEFIKQILSFCSSVFLLNPTYCCCVCHLNVWRLNYIPTKSYNTYASIYYCTYKMYVKPSTFIFHFPLLYSSVLNVSHFQFYIKVHFIIILNFVVSLSLFIFTPCFITGS